MTDPRPLVAQPEEMNNESRSPDGDGLGMTRPDTASDSAFVRASIDAGTAKSSGQTTAAKAERKSPTAGAGSEPADSHSPTPSAQPDPTQECLGCFNLREQLRFAEEKLAGSAPTPSAWQPIETAPKDGTWVLIRSPSRRHAVVAHWADDYSTARVPRWTDSEYTFEAEQWLPLPPPPPERAR